jgi:hypothetical protein
MLYCLRRITSRTWSSNLGLPWETAVANLLGMFRVPHVPRHVRSRRRLLIFQVERFDPDDRIVQVNAKKL